MDTTRLDAVMKGLDAVKVEGPPTTQMTKAQWDGYVAEQLKKAKVDADEGKARLEALAEGMVVAKASFATSEAVAVTPYQDPAAQPAPTSTTVSAPVVSQFTNLFSTDGQVQKGAAVTIVKALSSLNKALAVQVYRDEVSKAASPEVRTAVTKGDAQGVLTRIANMFGIDMSDADDSISWRVQDAVRVIENAAKLEGLMATLGSDVAKAIQKDAGGPAGQGAAEDWPFDMSQEIRAESK